MTSFEMAAGSKPTNPFSRGASWVLQAPLALFRRLLRAQREYLAIQHLQGLEREQLEDNGLERGEIVVAVRGRQR